MVASVGAQDSVQLEGPTFRVVGFHSGDVTSLIQSYHHGEVIVRGERGVAARRTDIMVGEYWIAVHRNQIRIGDRVSSNPVFNGIHVLHGYLPMRGYLVIQPEITWGEPNAKGLSHATVTAYRFSDPETGLVVGDVGHGMELDLAIARELLGHAFECDAESDVPGEVIAWIRQKMR
ncbi:hypothetical protein HGA91_00565 [candidate division WWE3 bacterium]|nr:hypothetical protein [candidate division WWE3 bacterium]